MGERSGKGEGEERRGKRLIGRCGKGSQEKSRHGAFCTSRYSTSLIFSLPYLCTSLRVCIYIYLTSTCVSAMAAASVNERTSTDGECATHGRLRSKGKPRVYFYAPSGVLCLKPAFPPPHPSKRKRNSFTIQFEFHLTLAYQSYQRSHKYNSSLCHQS
jgi:hypothetical protein